VAIKFQRVMILFRYAVSIGRIKCLSTGRLVQLKDFRSKTY